MGTWLLAISITNAPLDVIHIGSHLIRHTTSMEATGLGLFLISLRMSLLCLQHHLLRHCFFVKELWSQCTTLFVRLMLPQGFPQSVTFDYLDYSLRRAVQGIASQVRGVLTTQVSIYYPCHSSAASACSNVQFF